MSICHNTLRTTSPFSGYIASPEYPQIPNIDLNSGANRQEVEATNNIDMLCQCEISGLSSSAQIELSLLDMYNSDQVGGLLLKFIFLVLIGIFPTIEASHSMLQML